MATQNVLIFRDGIETGYEMMANARQVTVITVVAPYFPQIMYEGEGSYYAKAEDKQKMYATILAILEAAAEAGCKVLVLSAFGCGAFAKPVKEVAELFYAALTKFQDKFGAIVFVIIDEIIDAPTKEHGGCKIKLLHLQ